MSNIVKVKKCARLAKAEEFLRTLKVPKNAEFNMNTWGEHPKDRKHAPAEQNFCGTSACAFGWIAVSGKFKGIETKWGIHPHEYDKKAMKIMFKGKKDFDAAKLYFGINAATASWLFGPSFYSNTRFNKKTRIYSDWPRTAKRVARRMRMLLKGLPEDNRRDDAA